MPEKGNPSETVLHVHSIKARDFIPVKGILDSGATQDWISRDLVVRLGATSVALAEPTVFEDFQGGTLRAESRVQLRWHGNRSLRTREGCFLVAETGPFDIVIGSDFLFAEGVFTFNEAALMNHQRPLKQGEYTESHETKKMSAVWLT